MKEKIARKKKKRETSPTLPTTIFLYISVATQGEKTERKEDIGSILVPFEDRASGKS